jgi:hypothetical protein
MISSGTGIAERNALFYTDFREDRDPEWWTVVRYEPCRAMEFVRFAPDLRIARLDIPLAVRDSDAMLAAWTQTLAALVPQGDTDIESYGPTAYIGGKDHLEAMPNHYLQTRTMLAIPETAKHSGARQA